ncbi:MAG: hypothetical protein KC912_14740 [Proteobacteria bacterium]|nr:hypothetical protein [Pseudomonadota bacterium]
MRLLLLIPLIACSGPTEDSGLVSSITLTSPGTTPEVGELVDVDVIFIDGAADRVEWSLDGERVDWGPVSGTERETWTYAAPAEAYTLGVKAFYGMEFLEDEIALTAVPNTAPVLTITSPTETNIAVDTLVTLGATIEDRTEPPLTCTWSVGGSVVRTGEVEDDSFASAWDAISGSWELAIHCTDGLGLESTATHTVQVP